MSVIYNLQCTWRDAKLSAAYIPEKHVEGLYSARMLNVVLHSSPQSNFYEYFHGYPGINCKNSVNIMSVNIFPIFCVDLYH